MTHLSLRVLTRLSPTVDLMTLQAAVASLSLDINAILKARVLQSEALSMEPAEDTLMVAVFSTTAAP